MSKYPLVKLGDICDLQMGKTPSRNNSDYWNNLDHKWVSIADLTKSDKYINNTKETISSLAVKESKIKLVPQNTVIMSFKLSLGKTAITSEPLYTNEAIMSFNPIKKKQFNNDFLYHLFKSFDWSKDTNKAVKGTTLNKSTLSNIKIPLPPIQEQKHIADTLDTASDLINLHKQSIIELDNLIQSTFIDMFGDPIINDMGWEVKKIGDVIETLTDFSANGSYKYLDSNVIMYDTIDYALMVRTTDLEKNDFTTDVKYVNKKAYEILSKSKIFGNEIIMNKIGSAGKIFLMPNLERPVTLGRNAFLIRFYNIVNPIFIFYMLNTEYGKKQISIKVRGAVTKTITKESVKELKFPIPPLDLQEKFADIVTAIEEQKSISQQALDDATMLYNRLLQDFFE